MSFQPDIFDDICDRIHAQDPSIKPSQWRALRADLESKFFPAFSKAFSEAIAAPGSKNVSA